MRRPRNALHLAVAAASLLLIGACRGAEPPNLFVLITVDTLRADYLGAYGSDRGLTPNLDALARESLVFTAAYSATSFTLPSVSALLTGRYPEEFGIWNNESALPQSAPTLATELRRRGWRTAAVVSNFVLRESSGLAAGFDVYDDEFPQKEAVRRWPERIAADTTDAFIRTLDACTTGTDAPCFVWVHYQDPHGPYTPPSDRRSRYLEIEQGAPDGRRLLPVHPADYAGPGGIPRYQYLEGRREDEEIGRLLAALRERGLDGKALVAFAADHGEGLGEDDYWFAHGAHLTDPLVRVPLLLRVPGRPPERRDDIVAAVDLYPTVLRQLVGAEGDPPARGRDLLAPDAAASDSVPYLATLGAGSVRRFGIVEGDYKFIVSLDRDIWRSQLFRRGRESVNLAAPAPQITASLRARLLEFRERLPTREETRQKFSPEDLEKLRALGYVDLPRADAAEPSPTPTD
jgi:arylsulfatase